MSKALTAALTRLLQSEAEQLAASQLTDSQKKALDELQRRTGAVSIQRKGRGILYRIIDRAVIEQHLSQLIPLEANQIIGAPKRAANIGLSRSSKSGMHTHEYSYILLKARGNAVWHKTDGQQLNLLANQQQLGVTALKLGDDNHDDWRSSNPLWLVENQEVFDQLDWLPSNDAATVLWYSGNLQNNLIHWLAKDMRAEKIILFADYDGVGMQNYLRIKRKLAEHVQFWLMPNWRTKLNRYGNNELWQKTSTQFDDSVPELIKLCATETEFLELIKAMQKNGLALEQEAVWLPD